MTHPKYTKEQIEFIQSGTPIKSLASMAIFQGMSSTMISNARQRMKGRVPTNPQEYHSKGHAYKGERVKLYQFITTAQATPERTREWLDMSETERRRMHQETSIR